MAAELLKEVDKELAEEEKKERQTQTTSHPETQPSQTTVKSKRRMKQKANRKRGGVINEDSEEEDVEKGQSTEVDAGTRESQGGVGSGTAPITTGPSQEKLK